MKIVHRLYAVGLVLLLSGVVFVGCSKTNEGFSKKEMEDEEVKTNEISQVVEEEIKVNINEEMAKLFDGITLSDTQKKIGKHNPLITQRLGADPYAMVYDGRVYIYMTGDVFEYGMNKEIKKNTYGKVNTINVISSADLVNWTDHGSIYAAGKDGASKWGNNSWAPAATYKEIDGKPKFFIYFANGGNGIGVLSSDSPTGPFVDPIKKPLISRETPNCADVAWLFDPAVLVDDDGRAYLYFGGGVPEGKEANPGTGRVIELGADMTSIVGEAVRMDIPYLFEDSGINKINGTYYYSYCSNWQITPEAAAKQGFGNAEIIYMTSDHPMGPFTLQGSILKNPGEFFGCYGNNHHCMFEFNDEWYMAYHTQLLEKDLGIDAGYRSTHIDAVTINEDGSIKPITATRAGVKNIKNLDPYNKVEAETMVTMGGINTTQYGKSSKYFGSGNMTVCDIETGDWISVSQVDFGQKGASDFTAAIKISNQEKAAIQIRIDSLEGEVIGYLPITLAESEECEEITTKLLSTVTGVHDLYFIFYGEGYEFDYWYFK